MTAPRQVLAGSTYLLSRRCAQGQLLLRPDAQVNQVFQYCLAYAACRFDIHIHAYCVMSNHWHAVLTDPHGRISEFLEWVHKYVAKSLNAYLKRSENFWSSRPPSLIPLRTAEDVLNKVAYVLDNPVRARLVHKGPQWPGLWSDLRLLDTEQSVRRPAGFFRNTGPMPKVVRYTLSPPPVWQGSLYGSFYEAVRGRLKALRQQARSVSRHVLGVSAVLKQRPTDVAPRRLAGGTLNPQVAAQERGIRITLLHQLREFRKAYRRAWVSYTQGFKDTVFPAGTYWMKRFLNVCCVPV